MKNLKTKVMHIVNDNNISDENAYRKIKLLLKLSLNSSEEKIDETIIKLLNKFYLIEHQSNEKTINNMKRIEMIKQKAKEK